MCVSTHLQSVKSKNELFSTKERLLAQDLAVEELQRKVRVCVLRVAQDSGYVGLSRVAQDSDAPRLFAR